MNNSPFQSKKSEEVIISFISKDIPSLIQDTQRLLQKVLDIKIKYFFSFRNPKLKMCEEEFEVLNGSFSSLYRKILIPDDLFKIAFKSSTEEETKRILLDYRNFKPVLMESFPIGFHLLEITQRSLDRKLNIVYRNISISFAVLSLIVSAISIFLVANR